ncbi:MAG: hypothetical protein IAF58_03655 [Leptolyngbya sp.]|nr:hypothetical protein [Candidatus Melainabacteria bacterium]
MSADPDFPRTAEIRSLLDDIKISANLSPRHRDILRLYYGGDTAGVNSLSEIAQLYGVNVPHAKCMLRDATIALKSSDLQRLVEAYLKGTEGGRGSAAHEENWWAISTVMFMTEKEPERLWQFIVAAYPGLNTERMKAVFAAGPIEDLLSHHGEQVIDRIEELALTDDNFRYLLGGVWRAGTPKKIWKRLENIRGSPWKD